MNILIIGSGGREHTLAWKLKQSELCDQLFIAPGNAGTALLGSNIPLATTDFEGLTSFWHGWQPCNRTRPTWP